MLTDPRQAKAKTYLQLSACLRKSPARALAFLVSATALVLAISVSACAKDSSGATPVASFQIESPTSTASVRSPVALKIVVRGATIGRPEEGLDHLHIAVDHGDAVPVYKMPPAPLTLAPGQHVLAAELAGPDHKPITAVQTVTFTVAP